MIPAVLYTEALEPITVVELPEAAYYYIERNGYVRIPVTEPLVFHDPEPHIYKPLRDVRIWAERFVRKGRMHHFLFTDDDENALLLRAAFLPGQRRGMREREARARAKGFLDALRALG